MATAVIINLKKIVSIYNLFVTIIGTLTNTLTIMTCFQKDLREISTFKLYAFNAISDIVSLYPWNIRQFILYNFGLDLETTFLWWCIGASYIQFTTFEISAWLLVTFIISLYHEYYFKVIIIKSSINIYLNILGDNFNRSFSVNQKSKME